MIDLFEIYGNSGDIKLKSMPFEPESSISSEHVTLEDFAECLHSSDTYYDGSEGRKNYIDASMIRLHRIFNHINCLKDRIKGPTLDVASGWGLLFPAFNKFIGHVLPYHIAEMGGWDLVIDEYPINGCKFECDKDILGFDDQSFGLICFFDCLEHLIVDPMWTLLEFNRTLKMGGHIAISTPNAMGGFKIINILSGINPATESEIKPGSIYQRHNREWTPLEIKQALECCGFSNFIYSTNSYLLSKTERDFLDYANNKGMLGLDIRYYGPEIFVIAQKSQHVTLNSALSKAQRWPEWLYTEFDAYRKRPEVFPIIISNDYA